jgi:hypothetical protein
MKKAIFILFLLLGTAGIAGATGRITHFVTDSVYICKSKSAYAYHQYQCRGLARCTHGIVRITKAQAIKLGYKPCKICYN